MSPSSAPRGSAAPAARRRPALLTALVIGVALAVLAVLAVGTQQALARVSDMATGRPQHAGATPPPAVDSASSASHIVRSYLSAVAAGRAAEALSYGVAQPPASTALTQQLLTAALRDAPVDDIEVADVYDAGQASVPVTFTLGGRRVMEFFEAEQVNGTWKLRQAFAAVALRKWFSIGGTLRVNGLPVSTRTRLVLLPGRYTMSSGHWAYRYVGDTSLLVTNPALADRPPAEPAPTRAARASYEPVVKRALARCLRAKTLQTFSADRECPFSWRNTGKDRVRVSSVRWEVERGPEFTTSPAFRPDWPAHYVGAAYVTLATRITCPGPCYNGSSRRTTWYQTWQLEPVVYVKNQPPRLLEWRAKTVGRPLAV